MVICDSFVMLNYPKTGSTFAREVLRDIHSDRLSTRPLPVRFGLRALWKLGVEIGPMFKELEHRVYQGLPPGKRPPRTSQHGGYSRIPDRYRDREVVCIVPNPYTRFMSRYQFGFWKEYLGPISLEKVRERFPSFPDLTLVEFAAFDQMKLNHVYDFGDTVHVGANTLRFIIMFFFCPHKVIDGLTDEYVGSDAIFEDMVDELTLLQQENLNVDLASFLRRHGYTDEELNVIREKDRVNVSDSPNVSREELWTEEALQYVEHHERLVFRMLEARGISYERPMVQEA